MLYNLPNLETILVEIRQKMEGFIEPEECADDAHVALRLKHVKIIHISDSQNLVCLFKIGMLYNFPNLTEISFKQCKRTEVVIELKRAQCLYHYSFASAFQMTSHLTMWINRMGS